MPISTQWQRLPDTISHVGYVFQLKYKEFNGSWYIGYFVFACFSKKRDKKAAFNLGFWTDKDPKFHTSGVNTPILTGIPLFYDNDQELERSFQALERNLVNNFGYIPPISATAPIIDTEFEEMYPLSIMAQNQRF